MTASTRDPRSDRYAGQNDRYARLYERFAPHDGVTTARPAREGAQWDTASHDTGRYDYDAGGYAQTGERHAGDHANAGWDILPDDRAGPPLVRRRGKRIVRGVALFAVALGAIWAVRDGPSFWTAMDQVSSTATGVGKTIMERGTPQPATGSEKIDAGAALLPLSELSPKDQQYATPPSAGVDDAAPTASSKPEAGGYGPLSTAAGAPPEPLPPSPPVASLDAHQKRAAAAGLHTDLSRALLERLTDADYRNAAIAIRMAFAENDDTTVLIWPRQAQPALAQFQVHFVPGAPGCRRYVVTIAKQGWSTTAMPLERCGKR